MSAENENPLSSEVCRDMIVQYNAAIRAVLKGQSYTIGGRSMTRADLTKLHDGVRFWRGMLADAIATESRGGRRGVKVRPVIPHG